MTYLTAWLFAVVYPTVTPPTGGHASVGLHRQPPDHLHRRACHDPGPVTSKMIVTGQHVIGHCGGLPLRLRNAGQNFGVCLRHQ
jgi:hypothetical protein